MQLDGEFASPSELLRLNQLRHSPWAGTFHRGPGIWRGTHSRFANTKDDQVLPVRTSILDFSALLRDEFSAPVSARPHAARGVGRHVPSAAALSSLVWEAGKELKPAVQAKERVAASSPGVTTGLVPGITRMNVHVVRLVPVIAGMQACSDTEEESEGEEQREERCTSTHLSGSRGTDSNRTRSLSFAPSPSPFSHAKPSVGPGFVVTTIGRGQRPDHVPSPLFVPAHIAVTPTGNVTQFGRGLQPLSVHVSNGDGARPVAGMQYSHKTATATAQPSVERQGVGIGEDEDDFIWQLRPCPGATLHPSMPRLAGVHPSVAARISGGGMAYSHGAAVGPVGGLLPSPALRDRERAGHCRTSPVFSQPSLFSTPTATSLSMGQGQGTPLSYLALSPAAGVGAGFSPGGSPPSLALSGQGSGTTPLRLPGPGLGHSADVVSIGRSPLVVRPAGPGHVSSSPLVQALARPSSTSTRQGTVGQEDWEGSSSSSLANDALDAGIVRARQGSDASLTDAQSAHLHDPAFLFVASIALDADGHGVTIPASAAATATEKWRLLWVERLREERQARSRRRAAMASAVLNRHDIAGRRLSSEMEHINGLDGGQVEAEDADNTGNDTEDGEGEWGLGGIGAPYSFDSERGDRTGVGEGMEHVADGAGDGLSLQPPTHPPPLVAHIGSYSSAVSSLHLLPPSFDPSQWAPTGVAGSTVEGCDSPLVHRQGGEGPAFTIGSPVPSISDSSSSTAVRSAAAVSATLPPALSPSTSVSSPQHGTAAAEAHKWMLPPFCTPHRRDIRQDYDLGAQLGRGGYADVRAASRKVGVWGGPDGLSLTGGEAGGDLMPPSSGLPPVVVKCITKRYLRSEEERHSLVREVDIHASISALSQPPPRISPLFGLYEDEGLAQGQVYLVVGASPGGDLRGYTRGAKVQRFSEFQVRILADQLLEALDFLHGRGIVHGDVKPENVLVHGTVALAAASPVPLGEGYLAGTSTQGAPLTTLIDSVRLCDFGNARRSRDPRYYRLTGDVGLVPFTVLAGTVGYLAPEILARQNYGTAADMFSLGVVLYEMLAGFAPWFPASDCLKTPLAFPSVPWAGISAEARALIARLLSIDPRRRITAHAARAHPWLGMQQ